MAKKNSAGGKGQQLCTRPARRPSTRPKPSGREPRSSGTWAASPAWGPTRRGRARDHHRLGRGGVTSQQGGISDEQWDVFKLAFLTTGRIAVLSDQAGEGWMYDYRFLEAVR